MVAAVCLVGRRLAVKRLKRAAGGVWTLTDFYFKNKRENQDS